MNTNCTLLVSSYDEGEDLWEGFFTCLVNCWPELKLPVVLNTETKDFSFPGLNIKVINTPNKTKNMPWAKRLKHVLGEIETDYVLFFLEDFWLESRVDNDFFEKTIEYIQSNPDVACFNYQTTNRPENVDDGRFDRFVKRDIHGEYRLNCQCALWDRKKLIRYLRDHETPWEWERYGSIRSARFKQDTVYCLKKGAPAVFPYNLHYGGVIHRGKWNKEIVVDLAEKYHLDIDYSKRGFENWEEIENNRGGESSLTQRIKSPYLLKRVKARLINEIRKAMSLL